MSEQQHITVVIPQQSTPSSQLVCQSSHTSGRPSSQDTLPGQQQQPWQRHQPQQQHSQHPAQQYWSHGMQHSVDDLASYVDHIASASAKSALSLHQTTWQEKQQLEAIVKQQSARLQQQAAELEVLRGLSRQQQQQYQQQPAQEVGGQHCPWQVQQQQSSQQMGAGGVSAQDSRLQRHMEWHKQEVAEWFRRCSAEKQGRLVAETALQDTLAVVEHLEAECAGISGMLNDVVAVEAAAAAAKEAEAATSRSRWRPALGLQTTRLGLAVFMGAAVFVAACAAVASAFIALSIKGCSHV